MKIDLKNKVSRFLVQEYVNKICNYYGTEDLNYNLHKLIHTFQVVEMAQKLINLTQPRLSKKIQKYILNAAILHDVGRCYEYQKGKQTRVDHGEIGAKLIQQYFPEMTMEREVTFYHNRRPSDNDPKTCQPVLDYLRDADMLANLRYEIDQTDVWLSCIVGNRATELLTPLIYPEIFQAAKERRLIICERITAHNLLTMWMRHLSWISNLKTKAGLCYAKESKIFLQFKQTLLNKLIPLTTDNLQKQEELIQQIQKYFPDSKFV